MLKCVAACCSVLQCVAACFSVLQCDAACCRVLQHVAACCSVLQCVAVCCSADYRSHKANWQQFQLRHSNVLHQDLRIVECHLGWRV